LAAAFRFRSHPLFLSGDWHEKVRIDCSLEPLASLGGFRAAKAEKNANREPVRLRVADWRGYVAIKRAARDALRAVSHQAARYVLRISPAFRGERSMARSLQGFAESPAALAGVVLISRIRRCAAAKEVQQESAIDGRPRPRWPGGP
jgi:hypothetical protein